MKLYKMLPEMLERFKEQAASENASGHDKTKAFILGNVVANPQSSFRQCISFMLSHLDKCAANMKTNLEKLNPNWMVSEPPGKSDAT